MSVTIEVLDIKRQNFADLMNGHRGHDSCIVDMNARDPMLEDEPPPSREDLRGLWQQTNDGLKPVNEPSACSGVKPSPFAVAGRVAAFQNSTRF